MNLGFVGLGAMGELIVPRLMAAGHKVTGWNRTRAKAEPLIAAGMAFAARRARSRKHPRSCSPSSPIRTAVKAVALGPDGIISGLKKGGIYIDMSTIEPDVEPRGRRASSPRPAWSCSTGRSPAAPSR